MKKIILLLIIISVSIFSFSQELALRFGFQFTGTSSWFINKQAFDDGGEQNFLATSLGRYFGPTITFKFTEKIGIELGLNFNKINQKYEGDIKIPFIGDDKLNHYYSTISYKSVDIPLMFQFGNKVYFELGPILHMRGKVTYTREFSNNDISYAFGTYDRGHIINNAFICSSEDNLDVTTRKDSNGNNIDIWEKTGFGVAIGIGGNIELPKNFIINLGLRANYIVTDMQGINGLNFTKNDYNNSNQQYDKFKNNPLYAGIRIALIYQIPL